MTNPEYFARHGAWQRPLSTLEAALLYAEQGWQVLPVLGKPYTYIKRVDKYKNPFYPGVQIATNDKNKITQWFTRHPLAGVGIKPGCASGIFIIDIDVANFTFPPNHPLSDLPPTRTALTGKGKHLFYRYPDDGTIPSNYNLDVKKVDVLGERGAFAVAAPSMHNNGIRYQWDDFDAPIAAVPQHVLTYLQEQKEELLNRNRTVRAKMLINTYIRHALALIGQ